MVLHLNMWTNFKYELSIIFLILIVLDAFFFIMRKSFVNFFMSINNFFVFSISDLCINM